MLKAIALSFHKPAIAPHLKSNNDHLQQFAFKPATNKNIKPIAGLRPATHFVVGLSDNCCIFSDTLNIQSDRPLIPQTNDRLFSSETLNV
ncbi:hypothetical protein APA_4199 [Pseudanabaena sp. lw0831]|uniref:hypothetical protein n=1 Tax=Pseudanabaena sp. lw0831 TaxID=1357935 RepID=UPI001915988D|nr:hypothetical protein [Pseudanabaena sp. lw0831]GBO55993.1 hypothetical protein APA_4199 [Pseudanabaena sp. lw0831]